MDDRITSNDMINKKFSMKSSQLMNMRSNELMEKSIAD